MPYPTDNPFRTPDGESAQTVSARNSTTTTIIAAFAAFSTYFCMYAFRKPFTAGTFEDQEFLGLALKTLLVLSQLSGYMLAKFVGVKIISEMPRAGRAAALIGLMTIAELTLVGFAFFPTGLKVLMLFLNGLSLGMIFGLVMAYLEGRRHTEVLAAVLAASFIMSSGFVKSVGRWLIESWGVSEFSMPYVTGLLFFIPMLVSVWLLNRTPDPAADDRELRSERPVMTRQQRKEFFRAYAPGLIALILVYIGLTVVRTMRDDFGVEIWQALGVKDKPQRFAQSETIVAVIATAVNGLVIYIVGNLAALRTTAWMMSASFVLVAASAVAQWAGYIGAFPFMVACGIGLYIPYVAYHTTIFERIIAASRHTGNIGFLMYLADSIGYLGYAVIMLWSTFNPPGSGIFPYFRTAMLVIALGSMSALLFADVYFHRVLAADVDGDHTKRDSLESTPT